MFRTRMLTLLITFLFFFSSCSNDSPSSQSDETLNSSDDLEVAEDFSFRTINDVEVNLQVLGFDQIPLKGVRLTLFDGNPAADGRELSNGATDENGLYETSAQISSFVTELYLQSNYGTVAIPVEGSQVSFILETIH
ncbi:MAG: hypothetical protein ACRBF0_19410 [Calditrichia bacterium]